MERKGPMAVSNRVVFSGTAPLIIAMDQWTKQLVTSTVAIGTHRPIIEGFFSITHSVNEGIILGWLWGSDVRLFVVLVAVALVAILGMLRHLPAGDRAGSLALGMILGGAFGNLLDRLLGRGVIDFLHFDLGGFAYPDFNLADSAIVVG